MQSIAMTRMSWLPWYPVHPQPVRSREQQAWQGQLGLPLAAIYSGYTLHGCLGVPVLYPVACDSTLILHTSWYKWPYTSHPTILLSPSLSHLSFPSCTATLSSARGSMTVFLICKSTCMRLSKVFVQLAKLVHTHNPTVATVHTNWSMYAILALLHITILLA